MKIEKMVRREILNFRPYLTGKPVSEVKRELGIKGSIIKLASNENPFPPPPGVIKAVRKAASSAAVYPEGASLLLRRALAKKHRVKPANIIPGSGTDEIIELIGKVFFGPKDNIIVSKHAFIRYKMAGDLMGCRVTEVPMKHYTHDIAAMASRVNRRTKAVFIANPNNPTGTYNTEAEIKKLIAGLRKKGSPLLVLDEAYYEYARSAYGYPDSVKLLRSYGNIVVLRTFSKIHSLAGLRAGYAVTSAEITGYLDRIRPPFNVNSAAQAAALASLKCPGHVRKSLDAVNNGRKYLYRELMRLGLPFVNSAANFILISVAPMKGKTVFGKLLRQGVIARSMDEYGFPGHIRVTIGTPPQNRRFIKTLEKITRRKRAAG